MDQLPTFFPSFLYFPYESSEKVEKESPDTSVSLSEDETEEGSGEDDPDNDINDKITEEMHAMPEDFEKLQEAWKRSNDSSGSFTLISTTLTLMKERLSHMQLLLRERERDLVRHDYINIQGVSILMS